ncbi:TIGR04222 domain-containing membrane protein [Streptomyces sp. S465]|uniref:TIGR04222 domain-containing membrane protein n=1 Tax=Streptomyces sp. S465 TaxID=2979468 RepID=UPI0022A8B2E6|nr:TIGR04222 domain-containing membrane protein [Streptomyces sp. S465]WAP58848.1 TIGR04222 domain-containing membrane protein [Streptomyces sp. S465]
MLWVIFLLVAWGAAVVSCTQLCLAAVAAAQAADPGPAADGKVLSLYEAAFLSGGPRRVGDLTLVTMYRERRLLLAHTGWVTVVDPDGRDDLERSLINAIGPEGQSPVRPARAALATAAPVRDLADRLVAAGLAVPASARTNVAVAVRQVRAAGALVLVTAAAALLLVPPAGGRGAVAAWFALPLLLTASCLLIARVEAYPYSRWASPAGQRLLGRFGTPPRRAAAQRSGGGAGDGADGELLTAFALRGPAALPDPALRAALKAHWGH